MSRENVELIRSIFEPMDEVNVAEIDWSADVILEIIGGAYAPEVELDTLESGIGTGVDAHYEGVDGVVRYLSEWLEPFSDYRVQTLDYIDAGDAVLVPSRQRGIGSASGAEVKLELTTLYRIRDGKIVKLEQYDTLVEAREAAERGD